MTLEERTLLVQDILARVPYGLQMKHMKSGVSGILHNISVYAIYKENEIVNYMCQVDFFGSWEGVTPIDEFKPILRPLESITNEELLILNNICWFGQSADDRDVRDHRGIEIINYIYDGANNPCMNYKFDFYEFNRLLAFLNSHHFDYHKLIEKGLAIEADHNIYDY